MSTKEFTKIHELLERLRKETENCIARVEELEEELKGKGVKPSQLLNNISDPVRSKKVGRLLEVVGYEPGDTLRQAIQKLEAYILKNEFINYKNYNVIADVYIAKAFNLVETQEVSYEHLLGQIPTLFK